MNISFPMYQTISRVSRAAKRSIISVLLLCLPLSAAAQTAVFEATVVDAHSHEPLPFASVYVGAGCSTITNAVGTFSLKCDPTDLLRISYVGYQTQRIRADRLPATVVLQPGSETMLGEVVVLPLAPFIRKTTKETLRQLSKYGRKKSTFFYRQTAFTDSLCYEFVEAFLSGHSAVSLRDLALQTGRFAGIRPDSEHFYSFYKNFYTFSQIELATKKSQPDWTDDVMPLFRNYARYYNTDYDILHDDSTRLIVIQFEPKPDVTRPILAVRLYVDEQSMHIRMVEGQGRNVRIFHDDFDQEKKVKYRRISLTDFDFVIHMTEERGFVEVQSVYVREGHGTDGRYEQTRSLLFNLGDRKVGRGSHLYFSDDLRQHINSQGYDAKFWNENEIVRRTPVEQAVKDLFENHQLFGLFE